MKTSTARAESRGEQDLLCSVAGSIERNSPIESTVDGWIGHLARNGRSDKTCASWRRMILRDCEMLGIFNPTQINYATVVVGLERLREQFSWSASTMRCHIAAFKSLDRHVKRSNQDDIQAADGPSDAEPGDGSRAATLEEARRHMAVAYDMEVNDRRSRSARTLYWGCMFAGGCREDDHWHWRWSHLHLDGPVPFVVWTRGIQKNKRKMLVALAPELAERLREHREAMRVLARSTPTVVRQIKHPETGRIVSCELPVNPDLAESPVFLHKPPTDVFRKDRDRAEIPHKDARGRIYSPHSARKFFKTHLMSLGVSSEMSEFLMRHSPKVSGRYFDPSLEDQAEALARFPRLWPGFDSAQAHDSNGDGTKRGKIPGKSVDNPGRTSDAVGAESHMPNPRNISNPAPSGSRKAVCVSATYTQEGRASSCFSDGASTSSASVQAPAFAGKMSDLGAQARASNVAALLRCLADLMDSHGPDSAVAGGGVA